MMERGAHICAQLDRISAEADLVYRTLVLPNWHKPGGRMQFTLYGYVMTVFAQVDMMSAYWNGPSKVSQTRRMVKFMEHYMQTDGLISSVAVEIWRHRLMHTGRPRELAVRDGGEPYRYLLHWGHDHLPREQHFTLGPDGRKLNLSLRGLIESAQRGAAQYVVELNGSPALAMNFDSIEENLKTRLFRPRLQSDESL